MAANLMPKHGHDLLEAKQQERFDPLWQFIHVPTSVVWATLTILTLIRWEWPQRWLYSGSPLLIFLVLVGAGKGRRIMPFLNIWTFITTVNLVYSVASTSWLLYAFFTAGTWVAIFITCIFQFPVASDLVRRQLRTLLSQLQFVDDKIAFFNIPALEIDVDVAGLMVIRGITFSISTLTLEAHGIELGIKLSDDMELAVQTELVKVQFFRKIEVSDVFANLKGGIYEMTFGQLDESTADVEGHPLMDMDRPLLRAASVKADGSMPEPSEKMKMTEHMTDGKELKDSSAEAGLKSLTKLSPTNDKAIETYNETMDWIKSSNAISQTRKRVRKIGDEEYTKTTKSLRAAICSHLHDTPSVPHPPKRSIRVSTLKKSSPPWVQRFEHRLPLLLRLLLNPLSYFHPIKFSSITGTASGAWIKSLLLDKIFGKYADSDREIRSLRDKMMAWLNDANFAIEMDNITGLAQVPILTEYDITCFLGMKDILVFRTLPKSISLEEVVRLGGADASFSIPSYLLPHHEHILPPRPSSKDKDKIREEIDGADGKPQRIQAERDLQQAEKDETNVQMSVHARLPACLDQTLLDFVAALVKATKIIEMEKANDAADNEVRGFKDIAGFKDFAKNVNAATKHGIKTAVVGSVVNDRWISKLVGKVTKALETAQGDVGYSGSIPVALEPYRQAGVGEASKLLP